MFFLSSLGLFETFVVTERACSVVFLFYLLKGFVRHGLLGIVMDHINFCLYQATKSCHNLDLSQSIRHWDEAVAFYTGSIPRESGAEGYLFYTESEVQGYQFGTRSGSISMSNKAVFDNFDEGKRKLKEDECGSAEVNAEKIKAQMLIPLIQGLLRNTYQIDNLHDQHNDITRGEVAGYAAALLPSINNCDKYVAATIHNDLAPGRADESSFEVIKYNLERIYGCLGVSCSQVGGFLQPSGTSYWKNAEPCGVAPVPSPVAAPTSSSDNGFGTSLDPVPLILGLFGFAFLVAVGWSFKRRNSNLITKDIGPVQTELSLNEVNDKETENDVTIVEKTDAEII